MNNFIIKMMLAVILISFSYFAVATLVENKNYKQLESPVSTSEKSVAVVEFFSYGCPYCAKLEPALEKWLAQKPKEISFTRIAIPRKGKWLDYAKFYYALEMISKKEANRITPLLYAAIHEEKQALDSIDLLISWAEKQGVNIRKLKNYLASDAINTQIETSMKLAKSYQLEYVPTLFVNGKYQLILDSDTQYRDMPEQLNALIKLAKASK